MKLPNLTIQQKIIGLLIFYFVIASVAIASTLFVSWRLEGSAAAINDTGSERMRSYQIGFLLAQYIGEPSEKAATEITHAIALFEQTMLVLDKGDPSRPLLLPKDPEIRLALAEIQQTWFQQNKFYVNAILAEPDKQKAYRLLNNYSAELNGFVEYIDDLAVMVEKSQVQATRLLGSFQIGLVGLAFIGTILLICLFMRMVVSPVKSIKAGLGKMGLGDFSTRLPVISNDELGDLATGFNQMATQLQEIYATLEERIISKTRHIELKSRELAALYDAATFLNKASATETLCDGVLGKMVVLFSAQAGVIRLVDHKKTGFPVVACYGVSEEFLTQESQLKCGDCLCGNTVQGAAAISCNVSQTEAKLMSEQNCKREGFEGIVSVPIKARRHIIGVFNLFFRDLRILPPSELRLLETVSQHLGAAIENQRFVAREKEMARSEERNLLAQELHDSIAQSLAFLNIQVQLLQDGLREGQTGKVTETLAQIKEGIQESYDDVRELLVHFRTRIEHDDVDVAIQDILEKFEDQTGIHTYYEFEGNTLTLPPETVLQFLHIVHECLSNIRKHSRATQVDIHLSHIHSSECQLIIHDNGIGFDYNKDIGNAHVGLQIMEERTHHINGSLTIDSSPGGEGTTVCLTLSRGTNILPLGAHAG